MTIKPGRWSVNPGDIDPRYLDLWRELAFCIPLWSQAEFPVEIVTQTVADAVFQSQKSLTKYGPASYSDDANRSYITWSAFKPGAFGVTQGTNDPSFTIMALVRTVTGHGNNPGPISYTTTTGLDISDGAWALRLSSAGSDDWWLNYRAGGLLRDAQTNVEYIGIGNWALVVLTRKPGGNYTFYENGVLIATDIEATAWDTTNNNLDLVLHATDSNSSWSIGDIALVAGWNRVLSLSDVRTLWQDPFGFIRPSPLAIAETTDDIYAFFDITDMPADFGNADGADGIFRVRGVDLTSSPLSLHARIFRSDEATPLSAEVEVIALSDLDGEEWVNYQAPAFTDLDTLADKVIWDAAKVRLRWSGN